MDQENENKIVNDINKEINNKDSKSSKSSQDSLEVKDNMVKIELKENLFKDKVTDNNVRNIIEVIPSRRTSPNRSENNKNINRTIKHTIRHSTKVINQNVVKILAKEGISDVLNIEEILNSYTENIFTRINEVDSNCEENYSEYKKYLEDKLVEIDNIINTVTLKINDVTNNHLQEKFKIDKINDLLKFKESTDDILFGINKKIGSVGHDLQNYKEKFDSVYLENLYVPSIIGSGRCKFKNLKEYVEVRFIYLLFIT